MNVLFRTANFDAWLKALRDPIAVTYWLLCGGDKSSQQRDIRAAKALVQVLEDD